MTLVYMVNGDSSGEVTLINSTNNTILYPTSGIAVGNYPFGVAFSPNGSKAVVTNNNNNQSGTSGSISFINTNTSVVTTRSPSGRPNGVAIAPSGSDLYAYIAYEDIYSPSNNDLVKIYNMATYNWVADLTLDPGARPYGVAVTPDNSYVYVALSYANNPGPGKVAIIRTSDNSLLSTFQVAPSGSSYTSWGIAITPTGSPPTAYVTLQAGFGAAGKVACFDADGSSKSFTDIDYVDIGVQPRGVATDGSMVYVAATDFNTTHRLYYFSVGATSANYISTGSSTQPLGVALTPGSSKLFVGAPGGDKTLVYTPGSPPSLVTTITSSGGASFGMFIQQNQHANIPFMGGASSGWFGC